MSYAVVATAEHLPLGHALLAAWPGEPPGILRIIALPLAVQVARGAQAVTCPLDSLPDADDAEGVAALAASLATALS